jgi:predicted kinase
MTTFFEGINNAGPYFVMLVGLPGVGKSTFRQQIDTNAVVLSTDDWIQEKADWEGTTYDAIWARDIKQAESAMRAAFAQAIKYRANIIMDRTNLSAKKRKGWLTQLPSAYFKMALVFDTPDEVEHARRLQRPGKFIPPMVLDSMKENYKRPTMDEGWDLISVVPTDRKENV